MIWSVLEAIFFGCISLAAALKTSDAIRHVRRSLKGQMSAEEARKAFTDAAT